MPNELNMKRQLGIIFFSFLLCNAVNAQGLLQPKTAVFNRQDTLRGTITKERAWWDVKNYHLDVKVNPADSTIIGSNTIGYKVLQECNILEKEMLSLLI